jgi:predicted GIY-YIG superfamily endonuclease
MGNTILCVLENIELCSKQCDEELAKTPNLNTPNGHQMINNVLTNSNIKLPELPKLPKLYTIYILELADNKYYVGKTKDLDKRYQQHLSGVGSKWTEKHLPIRILTSYPNRDSFDEDAYTKRYMAKYGIDNVRGGSYCQVYLSKEIKSVLAKEINSAQDCCYKCGEQGHYAKDCNL